MAIRVGWDVSVAHDGVNLPVGVRKENGGPFVYASLELPTGEPVTVAVHTRITSVECVQLRRSDGSVIFENTR